MSEQLTSRFAHGYTERSLHGQAGDHHTGALPSFPDKNMPVAVHASRFRLAVVAPLLLGAAWSAHATNGYFAHGQGARSLGVAGVAAALPQDALVIATNPAGIAVLGTRLDAGLTWFQPDREATVRDNGVPGFNGRYSANGKRSFLIPEFGYTRAVDARWSLGLAVYGNGGMNTQYDQNPFAALGGQGQAGVNLEQLFVSPAAAYKVHPKHTVGLALNVVHQRFSARGLHPFAQDGTSADPDHVTNRGTSSSTGAGVRLGWLGQLAPGWQAGASWSSRVQGSFDRYRGLFAEQGGFDVPSSWTLGVSWQPHPTLTLGADYQRIHYSEVKSVGNAIDALLAGQPLGSSNGPGFGWRDIGVTKLGAVWQTSDRLTLRAGYSHAGQPIPAGQTLFNILAPGVVRDHVTTGFTWKAQGGSELTGYYAHALSHSVRGRGSIPGSFGGGEADLKMKQHIVGVAYGWRF